MTARHSEQLLRLLVDRVEDYAIFVLTPEGRIATWNPGAARIKGYKPEEIIGSHFSRFYLPEEVAAGKCEMELTEAARVGRFEDEGLRVRKDGSQFWANVVITALRDDSGQLVGYAKVTRDLTTRKQLEEDARKLAEASAEQRAASTMQAISTAFAAALTRADVANVIFEYVLPSIPADGGSLAIQIPHTSDLCIEWSSGYRDARLHSPSRIPRAGAGPHAVAARSGEPLFIEGLEAIQRAHPGSAEASERLRALASLPLVVRGQCIGVLGITRNLPLPFGPVERAMALAVANQCGLALDRALLFERELEAQRRANFLAQSSASLSSSLDVHTIVDRLANAAVPMLGDWCVIDLVEGDALRQAAVVHVDPRRVDLAREIRRRYGADTTAAAHVLSTRTPFVHAVVTDEDLVAAARDDEHLHALRSLGMRSALLVPIAAAGPAIGVLTLVWAETERQYKDTDVDTAITLSSRAALAIQNARLYEEVQQSVRVREDFMSIAGHELRTPLAAMQLNLQSLDRLLARPEFDQIDPTLRTRLGKAQRNSARLERLVTELLDVARVTSGKLQLELDDIDLAALVGANVSALSDLAARMGSELGLDLQPHIVGRWDRFRLEQVVNNLISNALKYGRGAPVSVRLRSDGGFAILEVEDQGIGIEHSQQRRIFERFERAVSERHYGGLGLGLWISRQIVDACGGTIDVQSSPGVGSLFTVRLPLNREGAAHVE